ncbi:uncharacterized protein LOC130538439 isoform X5 [Takifugu flavidus]|uniref:uncharacterized protein LOC130538439 isoform X4 n=1 Tax=Takifugu flavidus TaxID=433684 RepID=UPI002544B523|nr:uncharacterized protein LOC130538439 isoform X4 [Takifugu flavidus]XP_056912001.1 uncharacterized protein LOC130538439 isoform X5 [Takifugu flavidus]
MTRSPGASCGGCSGSMGWDGPLIPPSPCTTEELMNVAEERAVLTSLLKLLPPRHVQENNQTKRKVFQHGVRKEPEKLKMYFAFLTLIFFRLSWCFRLPEGLKQPGDTIVIVQLQTWGVVGAQQLKGHVLLNGVSLPPTNQEVDGIIKSMSVDDHLPNIVGVNLALVLRSCTVLRSRDCILEGSELHWTDRIFCDGKVYLTLGPNDTWIPHVPQAMALKALWDQEIGRTREERIRLQEGCFRLMRKLGLSVETSETLLLQYVIPVLCILAFTGFTAISLLLANRLGLNQPGGVIGSVIHYPRGLNEMVTTVEGRIYRTL